MTPPASNQPKEDELNKNPFSLDGRVAIVSGAARGIGLATSKLIAAAGARVLMCDLDAEALAEAQRQVEGETMTLALDLTGGNACEAVVQAALENWGDLHIVFNNAGYNWDAPLIDLADEQIQAMLDIHLIAPMRILRAAGRHFRAAAEREAAEGRTVYRKVINSSSISGTMGNPNQANYNAAKAAVIGLTKGLAKEWGSWNVNVNAIAPGFIETRLTAVAEDAGSISVAGREVKLGITAEHRRQGVDEVPLRRPGTAEEVARMVLVLASSASDYVTGQVVSVTGGVMLGMAS